MDYICTMCEIWIYVHVMSEILVVDNLILQRGVIFLDYTFENNMEKLIISSLAMKQWAYMFLTNYKKGKILQIAFQVNFQPGSAQFQHLEQYMQSFELLFSLLTGYLSTSKLVLLRIDIVNMQRVKMKNYTCKSYSVDFMTSQVFV